MKWKFRFGAALGNTLEYYDIAVFAAISVYLSAELERLGYPRATEMVWGIFALRFLIRPIGGYLIGRYADRVGKKSALILTSFITGTATLCMALLPIQWIGNYTPIAILIIQMALSFSYAGEYPSLITYLINGTPDNERSRISSLSGGSSLLGVVVSLGLVFLLESLMTREMMQSVGWRIPLFLGAINIAVSFWFRAKLPNESVSSVGYQSINWTRSLQVFLVGTPATATFYVQNVSSSLIVEHLQLGDYKSIYGMASASVLLIAMVICSCITDKYSSSVKVFNMGIWGVITLSIPLYFIMQSGIIELIIISQLLITVCFAMIWCNVADQMVRASGGQATTLGIGFNLTGVIIGGTTPLIISYLVGIHLAYVGMFIALCCLSAILANILQKRKVVMKKLSLNI
nr:MFS transporter [Providencia stuartii]ELR5081281.1 MFS transporter [Providencia stuartii]